MARILLVEDDPAVCGAIASHLGEHGHLVDAHINGKEARKALATALPDLIIADRMLPGISGDDLVRAVRERSDLPVLLLTALGEVHDRVVGLELGADDYLTKPFSLRELQLRVESLLRRSRNETSAQTTTRIGQFTVDSGKRRAWRRGQECSLTTREYELLWYFLQHPHEVHTRDHLMHELWGWHTGDATTVTVHVRRLREKIEPAPAEPQFLKTEWGVGYRFVPEGTIE